MNEERQKILNIFDDKVKLKNPSNREKQERIEQLIKETFKVEGKKDGSEK